MSVHFCDLLLLFILKVETHSLLTCHWKLVLISDFVIHSPVLEAVLLHLKMALVFLGSRSLLIHLLLESGESLLELIESHLSIFIQIEFLHEHLNLLLEWWESISRGQ